MRSNQTLRQSSKWRKSREFIQIWGLVIPGLAGILISVASSLLSPKDLVTNFLLFLFSILALAIGLERYDAIGEERREEQLRYEQLNQAINQLQYAVNHSEETLLQEIGEVFRVVIAKNTPVRIVERYEEVYKDIIRTLRTCRGSEIIRLIAFIKGYYRHMRNAEVSIFNEYLETLAEIAGQAKRNKRSLV